MHVVKETPNELVIKDSSMWLAAVFVIAGVAVALFGIAHSYPLSFLVSLILLLFAAPFARTLKFTFSSDERLARWRGRKIVQSGSGFGCIRSDHKHWD